MEGENKKILYRLIIVYCILLIVFAIPIVVAILKIQLDSENIGKEALSKIEKEEDVNAQRGTIYSSDGKILATTTTFYDVYIDLGAHKERKTKKELKEDPSDSCKYIPMIPDSVFDSGVKALSLELSNLFRDKTENEYYEYLTRFRKAKRNRHVLLKKNVQIDELEKMKTFPILGHPDNSKLNDTTPNVNKDNLPKFRRAIIVDERKVRVNPYGDLARHTIGFATHADTVFEKGLEGAYDEYLRGQKGKRRVRRLNKDIWIPVDDDSQIRAVNGVNIISTLDSRLQLLAQSSLKECLRENEADYGCVILMETETGYIRAISNLSKVDSLGTYKENRNIACTDLYEPGSTFKTVTAMFLLENVRDVNFDTSYIVPTGVKTFNKKNKNSTITDAGGHNYGEVSMARSFEVSSNVGTCQPVWDYYKNDREAFLYGIKKTFPYKRLDMDVMILKEGGEPMPTITNNIGPDRNFLNLTYGYVTSMTAMQMLTFYNAIANNGRMVKPQFCSEVKDGNKSVKVNQTVVLDDKICSESTLNKIKAMLKGVVENGSAAKLLSKTPYGIAGKTGTSQINYTNKNKVKKHRASFVGYFPADDPKYSCIVVITNPKKNKQHGGELAAPVFKDLADKVCGTILNIEMGIPGQNVANVKKPFVAKGNQEEIISSLEVLNIPFEETEDAFWIGSVVDSNKNVSYKEYKPKKGVVPDCKGMTVKDAVYMLEKMDLNVSFEGRGKVINQSLKPNSSYRKGDRIHLKLGILSNGRNKEGGLDGTN
jgi:cell division protein FtsI (penicillin-binding protein 3)